MRKYVWLVPVVVTFAVIAYLVARYGVSGRQAAADADALIADLDAHGAAIERADLPEVPDKPTETELHYRINRIAEGMDETRKQAAELQGRAENMVSRIPRDRQQGVDDALRLYVARLRASQERCQRRTDELRATIEGLRHRPKK